MAAFTIGHFPFSSFTEGEFSCHRIISHWTGNNQELLASYLVISLGIIALYLCSHSTFPRAGV